MDDLTQTISNLVGILLGLVGVVGVGYFIYGAYMYLTASGAPNQMERGKAAMMTSRAVAAPTYRRDGMREHEVPTHVQAEDKVLLWFTFPQIVAVVAVCALAYGAPTTTSPSGPWRCGSLQIAA